MRNSDDQLVRQMGDLMREQGVSEILEALALACFYQETLIHPAPLKNGNYDYAGKTILKTAWQVANSCNL